MSRLQRSLHCAADPGAMPQAITFRALGASETRLWRLGMTLRFGITLKLLFFIFVFLLLLPGLSFRPHMWEQNHVADGLLVGE
jgi:hypothetical protein